jgi:hypothetical protein
MPWSRRFDDPIQPPKGKPLITLKDAAAYIMKLPKLAATNRPLISCLKCDGSDCEKSDSSSCGFT